MFRYPPSILRGTAVQIARRPPHNWRKILKGDKEWEGRVPSSYNPAVKQKFCRGVLNLEDFTKYWIYDDDARNCCMLFAKGLTIQRSDDKNCWNWEPGDENIEVASLLGVGWLEVNGNFTTSNLSPYVRYELAFVVKMSEIQNGWEAPVTLKLTTPNGATQVRQEILKEKVANTWIEVTVGEFSNPRFGVEIEFSMSEYQSGQSKKGITIKGVIFRPKK